MLEANGTFVPLPLSSTNVYAIPVGSLIITSDGNLVSPPTGTFVTPYGLVTVTQAPSGGVPSAGTITGTIGTTTGTPAGTTSTTTGTTSTTTGTTTGTTGTTGTTAGTVSVNPGGPLQAPPQQPVPVTTPPTTSSTPPAPFANPPVPITIPGTQGCGNSAIAVCVPAGDGTGVSQGASATTAPVTTAPVTTGAVTTGAAAAAGAAAPASTGATGNTPMAAGTVSNAPVAVPNAPVAVPNAPVAVPNAPVAVPNAPVAAPKAAPPPVQIVSALGGLTVADNGNVTPNGSVNLAFPGSGIGGSLPLSLPSAAATQPPQLAFPPADQNVALADPIFQGLIQNLSPQAQPPVTQPAPAPDLSPSTAPGIAPANPDATPSNAVRLASLDNGVLSDAPPPGSLQLGQAGQPAGSGTLADLGPSNVMPTPPPPPQITQSLPSLPSPPAPGIIRAYDPTTGTSTDYPEAGTGNIPITPTTIFQDSNGLQFPQGLQPGGQVVVPTAPGLNFYVPQDYVAPVQPLRTTAPDNLNGALPEIPQSTIDAATQNLLHQEEQAPPLEEPPTGPPVPTNFLNPAADNAVPTSGQAPNIANQFAANGFGANGNPVANDVSPLPAGSFQTAAQTTAAQAGPAVAATTPSPGDTLPAGSQIVNPVSNRTFAVNGANGVDDTYPVTTVMGVPLLPGGTVTLPNTAQVHVSGANDFFPPGGGVSTLAPGTYQTANGTTLIVDGPASQAPSPQAPAPQAPAPQASSPQASDTAAPQVGAQQGQAADSLVQQAQNQLIPDPNTPLLPGGIAPNLIPPSGGVLPGGSTFTGPGGLTTSIPYDPNKPVTLTIPDSTGAGAGGDDCDTARRINLPRYRECLYSRQPGPDAIA